MVVLSHATKNQQPFLFPCRSPSRMETPVDPKDGTHQGQIVVPMIGGEGLIGSQQLRWPAHAIYHRARHVADGGIIRPPATLRVISANPSIQRSIVARSCCNKISKCSFAW